LLTIANVLKVPVVTFDGPMMDSSSNHSPLEFLTKRDAFKLADAFDHEPACPQFDCRVRSRTRRAGLETVEGQQHRHDANRGDDTQYPLGAYPASPEVELEFRWFGHDAALLEEG
jgi:hypothetical protein